MGGNISIHALLAESDAPPYNLMIHQKNFYPRSPCGERRFQFSLLRFRFFISIHALLAESDAENPMISINKIPFLSTLSLRRATSTLLNTQKRHLAFLSTLSLRRATPEEPLRMYNIVDNFYPRSPCGERQTPKPTKEEHTIFLSTLSLRRATPRTGLTCGDGLNISIHALLAESDPMDEPQYQILDISIHALLAESDGPMKKGQVYYINFYPRSPCGERPCFSAR